MPELNIYEVSASYLMISNYGEAIKETNFWESDHARAGYCYLSWNAGACRLLLPPMWESFLPDMSAAEYVIVSRGPWAPAGGHDALEILFEDHSDNPFVVHIGIEQTDRRLADDTSGFLFTVWMRGAEILRRPGHYRRVARLPWLKPWRSAKS